MGPLGVVVAQVALQVEAKPGLLRDEVASEGRLPALLQDGLLHSLDASVGLGSTGADEAVAGSQGGDGGLEGGGAELLGVVAHHPLQLPAADGQIGGHGAGELAGQVAEGLRRVTCRVAQVSAEATSMAVSCQTVPLVPLRRPMPKQ